MMTEKKKVINDNGDLVEEINTNLKKWFKQYLEISDISIEEYDEETETVLFLLKTNGDYDNKALSVTLISQMLQHGMEDITIISANEDILTNNFSLLIKLDLERFYETL